MSLISQQVNTKFIIMFSVYSYTHAAAYEERSDPAEHGRPPCERACEPGPKAFVSRGTIRIPNLVSQNSGESLAISQRSITPEYFCASLLQDDLHTPVMVHLSGSCYWLCRKLSGRKVSIHIRILF